MRTITYTHYANPAEFEGQDPIEYLRSIWLRCPQIVWLNNLGYEFEITRDGVCYIDGDHAAPAIEYSARFTISDEHYTLFTLRWDGRPLITIDVEI